jgi:hypothetical protein
MSSDYNDGLTFETRNIPSNAPAITTPTSFYTYGAQLEAALYPSSLLPPSGTRDPDILSGPAATLCPSGFFSWQIQIAPNFASSEQSADVPLLWFDGNDEVFLQQSSGAVVMRLGGDTAVTTGQIVFARERVLTLTFTNTSSGAMIEVQGATSGNGTTTGSSHAVAPLPTSVYILGDDTGAKECIDLQKLTVSAP